MAGRLPAGVQVAPSILSADFARLGEAVDEVIAAGARVIHCDVMDGHFVPPITFGALVVGSLAERVHGQGGVLDVHLMIERPERHIADFVAAGADCITVHAEATPHVNFALQTIKEAGIDAGLAICPATAPDALAGAADLLDVALCMTVNPGWGGQAFIPSSVAKIERIRALLPDGVAIEVDGGIDTATAGPCASAGASLLVAGSAVFGAPDPGAAVQAIAAAADS
jgi:ribulose-phosphate 3-epimerase